MFKRIADSFIFAGKGIRACWKEELNFRIEILAGLAVIWAIIFFEFSFIESALSILCITIVLSAEIVNTAIEDLCNKVEPNQNNEIGKIKDIMAAFVTVASLGALVVGIIVFYHHFSV